MSAQETGRRRLYPPVYFLLSVFVMLGFHWLVPGPRCSSTALRLSGALCLLAGLGLMFWGAGLFRQFGTTIKPFQESTVLVMTGPYRLTRNPMYLGMSAMLLGTALLLGSLWPVLVIPVFMILIERRFIRAEEAGLEAKFGEEYRAFKSRVRRWL